MYRIRDITETVRDRKLCDTTLDHMLVSIVNSRDYMKKETYESFIRLSGSFVNDPFIIPDFTKSYRNMIAHLYLSLPPLCRI